MYIITVYFVDDTHTGAELKSHLEFEFDLVRKNNQQYIRRLDTKTRKSRKAE